MPNITYSGIAQGEGINTGEDNDAFSSGGVVNEFLHGVAVTASNEVFGHLLIPEDGDGREGHDLIGPG